MATKSLNKQAYIIWRHFVLGEKYPGSQISDKNFTRKNAGTMLHKVIGSYHPSTMVSKMMRSKKFNVYKDFLDLETHKLSALVPDYKFYKIDEESGSKKPFYFQTAAEEITRQSILEIPTTRQVGVQSFSVEFVGKDPATAQKMLNFNMEIFSDNIKNIFSDAAPGYAKIAELFTIYRNKNNPRKKAGDPSKPGSQVKTAHSSEIAAEIGYSVPPESRSMFSSSELRTINNSKLHLRLTYNNHNISLQQDGRATVSIEFSGRITSVLGESTYNMLAKKDELIALAAIRSGVSSPSHENKANSTPQSRSKNNSVATKHSATNRIFFREQVMEKLENKGLLYDISLGKEAIKEIRKFEKDYNMSLTSEQPQESSELAAKRKPKMQKKDDPIVIDPGELERVTWFYLGDLIMQVSESMYSNLQQAKKEVMESKKKNKKDLIKQLEKEIHAMKDTRILTSNIYVKVDSPNDQTIFVANIADIPVTLSWFSDFYYKNIEQKYGTSFTMYEFLRSCVTTIVPGVFRDHVYSGAKFLDANVSIKSVELSGQSLPDSKHEIDVRDLPDFSRSGTFLNRRKDYSGYFTMYANHAEDTSLSRRGSRLSDMKDGIYHFYLGRNRGVLKDITFSKMDIKYRKEALITKSVSLYDQLKMPYNAQVSMFGNTMFMPGSLFFIDPSSVGMGDPREKDSAAYQLGIGGYYQATAVKISFNGSTLETAVQGTQVSWAEEPGELIQQLGSYISNKNRIGGL